LRESIELFDDSLGEGGDGACSMMLSSGGMGSSGSWRRSLLARSRGVRSCFHSMSTLHFPMMIRPVSVDSYKLYMYP
jgi:hypothetical protein